MLQHNNMTVMPLSGCHQLVPTIEKLQRHCNMGATYCARGDEQAIRESIVRNCVRGRPLADHKIAKLSCINGLSHLAAQVETEEGRQTICNALGKEDGHRLIAYFGDGPKTL